MVSTQLAGMGLNTSELLEVRYHLMSTLRLRDLVVLALRSQHVTKLWSDNELSSDVKLVHPLLGRVILVSLSLRKLYTGPDPQSLSV